MLKHFGFKTAASQLPKAHHVLLKDDVLRQTRNFSKRVSAIEARAHQNEHQNKHEILNLKYFMSSHLHCSQLNTGCR